MSEGKKKGNSFFYCCGCAGIGCLGVGIIIAIGAYFGFSFVRDKGRVYASSALKNSVTAMTKDAFDEKDNKIINQKVSKLADDIKTGKIGLIQLFKNVTQNFQGTNLLTETMALALKHHYFNKVKGEQDSKNPSKVITNFIYLLTKQQISKEQKKKFLHLVSKQFKSAVKVSGKSGNNKDSNYTITSTKLDSNLNKEKLNKVIETIKNITAQYKTEKQPKGFNPSATVKNQFLKILKSAYSK